VASAQRAATGTSENEKDARQGRAEYQECRYLPAPVRGAIQLGIRIQWLRAARLPLATILPRLPARIRVGYYVSVGKLYHYLGEE